MSISTAVEAAVSRRDLRRRVDEVEDADCGLRGRRSVGAPQDLSSKEYEYECRYAAAPKKPKD